jgi:2-polyprenyl-6-methoxyphenol hydroxylase-like FAD-dependent oxidoreductase
VSDVVIVGSGVVGGSTGKGFAAAGHAVHFVDVDQGLSLYTSPSPRD